MQLKKIKVYGKLRQFLGKSYFKAAVKSPEQAISFLFANYNGLEKHMNDQIYKIKMGGKVVREEYLSISGQGDIQIIPIATGSLPVVAGIGILASVGSISAVVGTGILGTTLISALKIIGTNLIIDGISNLLRDDSPIDRNINDTDPRIRGSYSFSGIQNISSSGVPIPIIYGYVYSGSILISAGVDTVQLVSVLSDTGTYSQNGFVITFNLNNHGFENGEAIDIEFTSGPIFDIGGLFNFNPISLYVENKTTNTFESNFAGSQNIPTSVKEHMTYDNSADNVFKPLHRINT
ncbi:MAG: hypothetical protein ACR2OP_05955 [Amylibacter sp.]